MEAKQKDHEVESSKLPIKEKEVEHKKENN